MRPLSAAFAVLLMGGLAFAEHEAPHITITGTGKVSVAPDVAHISVSVISEDKTAVAVWQENRAVVQKLFHVLDEHHIAARDRKTESLGIAPRYSYPKDQEPRIVGYAGNYGLSVTVHKVDDLGKLLDDLTAAGANREMGIRFGIDKPEAVMDEARERAIADARRKAELYAKQAGVNLGCVRSIFEEHTAPPRLLSFKSALAPEVASAALPVAPGEHEVTVTVTVTYALEECQRRADGLIPGRP